MHSFSFYGPFGKRTSNEERVQVLESIVLNSCVKVTTGDLHKIGLKMREWRSENLLAPKFPSKGGVMSRTPLPPCPLEKFTSGAYFFALLAMSGPLSAELKFKETIALLLLLLSVIIIIIIIIFIIIVIVSVTSLFIYQFFLSLF